jgi:hypothetical protein
MEKIIIKRDGLPPISFTGEVIGTGSTRTHNSTRWTTVDIYRTKGNRYIAKVSRLTCWQGESDHREAKSCELASEVIDYLKGDNDFLGDASQEAVEEATKHDASFAEVWVEKVE